MLDRCYVYSSKNRWSKHVEYNWFVLACVSDVILD